MNFRRGQQGLAVDYHDGGREQVVSKKLLLARGRRPRPWDEGWIKMFLVFVGKELDVIGNEHVF